MSNFNPVESHGLTLFSAFNFKLESSLLLGNKTSTNDKRRDAEYAREYTSDRYSDVQTLTSIQNSATVFLRFDYSRFNPETNQSVRENVVVSQAHHETLKSYMNQVANEIIEGNNSGNRVWDLPELPQWFSPEFGGQGKKLLIYPSIIHRNDDTTYPGFILCVNGDEYSVELTTLQLFNMIDCINNIDLYILQEFQKIQAKLYTVENKLDHVINILGGGNYSQGQSNNSGSFSQRPNTGGFNRPTSTTPFNRSGNTSGGFNSNRVTRKNPNATQHPYDNNLSQNDTTTEPKNVSSTFNNSNNSGSNFKSS
ncbi:hypothetical protein FPHOBKDP_00115 [Listeria phage LPJP1]|nr:hypothetical protein FPHOBKDP_00115 [Listeria phage LPJP1]